jgi:hypothetical protein
MSEDGQNLKQIVRATENHMILRADTSDGSSNISKANTPNEKPNWPCQRETMYSVTEV